jgi:hypothetical protein
VKPYIGIAGVMTAEEARALVGFYREAWEATGKEPTHLIAIGVLISHKTLDGGTNKWWQRYPRIADAPPIFQPDPLVLNVVHYSAGPAIADRTRNVLADVEVIGRLHRAAKRMGHYEAVQFNGRWPERAALAGRAAVASVSEPLVVLQVNAGMLTFEPRIVAGWIARYADRVAVAGVLLDPSGGKGIAFAEKTGAALARRMAEEIRAHVPGIGIGLAGGFSAETLTEEIGEHLRAGGSIDAESALRDDTEGGGNLDLQKAGAYLTRAVELAAGRGA